MRKIKKKAVAAFMVMLAGMTAGIGSLAVSTVQAEAEKVTSKKRR